MNSCQLVALTKARIDEGCAIRLRLQRTGGCHDFNHNESRLRCRYGSRKYTTLSSLKPCDMLIGKTGIHTSSGAYYVRAGVMLEMCRMWNVEEIGGGGKLRRQVSPRHRSRSEQALVWLFPHTNEML